MKAVVLAAGRGSRMGEKTKSAPKCFAELGGKKLIQWQKSAMEEAGISDVFAVGGYRSELLETEVPVPFINPRWAETNSVRSLMAADEALSDIGCVISYSDIVYHPDHVRKLIDSEGDIRITYDLNWLELWQLRAEDPLLDAETFSQSEGWLKEIGGKPENFDQIEGQYMGLLYISPSGWKEISVFLDELSSEMIDKMDLTALLSRLLERKMKIAVVGVQGKWCEMDTVQDQLIYEEKLSADGHWSHDWRW